MNNKILTNTTCNVFALYVHYCNVVIDEAWKPNSPVDFVSYSAFRAVVIF